MGKKLTEQERLERKFQRRMVKEWRRELCVELANKAIEANREATGELKPYLSPMFKLLITPHL